MKDARHMVKDIERRWTCAWWILFGGFVICAALNMMHVRAGILTNHGADLVVPAWLYISLRGLATGGNRRTRVARFFGRSPEFAVVTVFLGGTLTEMSQYYWPQGLFAGTFDPFDMLAFAIGAALCYGMEKHFLLVSTSGHTGQPKGPGVSGP